MIYLASQYSDPDELTRRTRFLLAEEITGKLLLRKLWVYSPIVHCHELALKFNLPGDFDYWKAYNFDMLRRADEVYVLYTPTVKDSRGVIAELSMAHQLGMKISFIQQDLTVIPWQE